MQASSLKMLCLTLYNLQDTLVLQLHLSMILLDQGVLIIFFRTKWVFIHFKGSYDHRGVKGMGFVHVKALQDFFNVC